MPSEKFHLEPPPSTLPPGSTVWAYLRDSGGPTQDRSVEQQRLEIIEYCNKYGLILALPPFEDIHKTGGTVKNRNEFDYMMSLSSTSERPNGLLIWNFARFSRGGAWDAQLYKATLRSRGMVIHSLTDKIPEGDFGPVIETLIDIANKQKKDEAAIGAWRGLRHNVKQGAVSGFPPVGMKSTPIKIISAEGIEHIAHRRDPDPDYSVRINKAFQMKAEKKSLSDIHAETHLFDSLNSYVTFFRNPIYIGTLHYGEMIVEDYCAPTVPRELWDKVQKVMDANAGHRHLSNDKTHPRRQAATYILSGIAHCARCGAPMIGFTTPQPYGKDYLRYGCSSAKRRKDCTVKPIPAAQIERIVLEALHKFFDNPQSLVDVITAFAEKNSFRQQRVDKELASIKAEQGSVRKKLANIAKAAAKRPSSKTLLNELDRLEEEEAEIFKKMKTLKSQSTAELPIPTIEEAAKQAQKVQRDLKTRKPEFIRQTLLGFIHQVTMDRSGKHLLARIDFYQTPTHKKKAFALSEKTMSISQTPVGAPIYRHSIFAEGIIPPPGRPRKKPLS